MDQVDYQIIERLQNNGRISIKKLAEIVSLTSPAVAERIRKLEKSGIIKGYRAVVDPEKFGLNIKAIINVTLKADKRKEFLAFVNGNHCILECHHVTGGFSMSIKVMVKKMEELEAIVGKIQHFGNTQTLVILSSLVEYKEIILEYSENFLRKP